MQRETSQTLAPKIDWSLILTGLIAIASGGVIGLLIAQADDPFTLVIIAVGLFVVVGTIARIEWGLLALVFMAYTRFSDVLVKYQHFPSVAKFFVVLVLAAVFIRWRLYGERPTGWQRATLLVVAFGLTGIAALLYAEDYNRALGGVISYFKDAIIAIAVAILIRRGVTLRRVIWMLLAAGIFMGTISVYQQVTGTYTNNYWGFGQAEIRQIVGASHDYRISGPIGDSNFYGQILIVLVPLALDRFWNERKRALRVLAAWALTATVLSIMFTFSRGAFVALVLVIGVMMIRRPPRPLAILITIAFLIPLLQFAPPKYVERMKNLLDLVPGNASSAQEDGSFRGQSSEVGSAWLMFIDHPLVGVGLGNSPIYYPRYSVILGVDPNRSERSAHSLYLEMAAERGLMGIFVFGALLWVMFSGMHKARKDFLAAGQTDYANLTLAFDIGMIGYMIAATFLHDAYPRFFWLLFGIALATPQVARRELELVREMARRALSLGTSL